MYIQDGFKERANGRRQSTSKKLRGMVWKLEKFTFNTDQDFVKPTISKGFTKNLILRNVF